MPRRGAALLLAGLVGLGPGWPGPGSTAAQPRASAGRQAPVEPAVVVDSLGRIVGPVIGLSPFPLVRLRAEGHDVLLYALGDRLVFPFAQAAYETPDCSGAPWIPLLLPSSIAAPIVEVPVIGRLGEILIPDGDPVTRAVRSRWQANDTPPACDPVNPAENHIVQPTRVLLIPAFDFTPPFRLR